MLGRASDLGAGPGHTELGSIIVSLQRLCNLVSHSSRAWSTASSIRIANDDAVTESDPDAEPLRAQQPSNRFSMVVPFGNLHSGEQARRLDAVKLHAIRTDQYGAASFHQVDEILLLLFVRLGVGFGRR